MGRFIAHALSVTALMIGGGSLIVFGIFIFRGPFYIVDLELNQAGILAVDAGLSLLFFIQHSWMIRQTTRQKIIQILPPAYYNAFYAVSSGLVLLAVVGLWQTSGDVLFSASGLLYWLLRALFLLAVGGFIWSRRSLGHFDPFGTKSVRAYLRHKKPAAMPLTIKGAYQWMRHPLYFFALIMIWASPHLTADRLLLNLLWTVWIFLGAHLEEKDLINSFGDQYRKYQDRVPMILPLKNFKRLL
ncbi:MAG: NnrU family protein [Desulfobacterales bacterium]|nr:NnrU family protein [Desulfobacterales bacterium]